MAEVEERLAALERHVERLTEVLATGGGLLAKVPTFQAPSDLDVVGVEDDLSPDAG